MGGYWTYMHPMSGFFHVTGKPLLTQHQQRQYLIPHPNIPEIKHNASFTQDAFLDHPQSGMNERLLDRLTPREPTSNISSRQKGPKWPSGGVTVKKVRWTFHRPVKLKRFLTPRCLASESEFIKSAITTRCTV
ncbi:hypothetical protein M378DRAFT_358659 [Amanita muscaria Koide BX008]|uniref:Uncharacterized protein n=1 Tax=Amanita muscaria (strain Koide BX008) TaxID=946122 RepID=A0A0C2WMH4_AMAMK|nr:hypothetical protein M378DRAFT_358659 [Amanita muscaria Koide BX008]